MSELKCPHCGRMFTVDDAEMNAVVKQIRDAEFEKDVSARIGELERHMLEKHALEMDAFENNVRLELQEKYENEAKKTDRKMDDLRAENMRLQSAVDSGRASTEAEVLKAVQQVVDEKRKLEMELASEKNKLQAQREGEAKNIEYEVMKAVQQAESEKRDLENKLISEKEKSAAVLAEKDEQINYYKDLKTKMSTKMVGETLEQHCQLQFEQLRQIGLKNVYFEKDNDAKSGSKGDYIYRETDEDGTEILSIMFEMKNEMDTTATKHKNTDFFKELDKDRHEKKCEYAVLVSLLEADNELYNAGIVDVSHKFEKMYVVRPQCFIPIISILRGASLKALEYKQELAVERSKNIDVSNFEDALTKFKDDFGNNYRIAHNHFEKAIEEIDKTIQHLQKVRDELTGSDRQLGIATRKVEDVSVKKLTKGNPTMEAKFRELKD